MLTIKQAVILCYFIPADNTNLKGVRINNLLANTFAVETNALGEWRILVTPEFTTTNTTLVIQVNNAAGSINFAGANDPDNDRIFIKDIVVEQR
jgi:hypothetical protein